MGDKFPPRTPVEDGVFDVAITGKAIWIRCKGCGAVGKTTSDQAPVIVFLIIAKPFLVAHRFHEKPTMQWPPAERASLRPSHAWPPQHAALWEMQP